MSKISTYPSADTPLLLSDRLIGTEAIRTPPSLTPLATKNFSLGDLLNLFSSNFPAATLQAVLNAGNTATQNITLNGTIDTTLIKPINIQDPSGSQGTTFQFISKGASGISWVNLPVDTLQAVLDTNNTATQNINLTGNITSTKIIPVNIQDIFSSQGTSGQVLSSTPSGIKWISLPTASIPGLGDVLGTSNTATNNINLTGTINTTNIKPVSITDETNSTGTLNQVLTRSSTGIIWAAPAISSPLANKGDLYTFTTTNARLGVGTNGQILSADSTAATGLRWINNTGGGGGITSLNGLTGATQTFGVGTTGTNFNISSSGTVHTFNLPDASSTARGVITIGAQDINGTKNFITDIVVNGVNIGAGPGNNASNVRIGQGAGASLVGVQNNILIGANAGSSQSKSGSTVIGGRVTPDNSIFNQDNTLSIGKLTGVPIDVDGALPHIWAPDVLEIDYSSTSNILVVSQANYSAIFIDYVISVGDISLRAGTIKAVWNTNGIIKYTEESTDSIGDTSGCIFSITYNNINNTIRVGLTNPFSAARLCCNFTSRLLTKPKLA